MRFPFDLALLVICCLALPSCVVAQRKIAGTESRLKVETWLHGQKGDLEQSLAPVSLKIPIVDFVKIPSAFGKPSWRTASGGRYIMGYFGNTKTPVGTSYSLSVFGCERPAPVLDEAYSVMEPGLPGDLDESPRTWATVQVPALGRTLRYQFTNMAFGDINDTWQTEPFTVTTPDGKTGSYQASIECENAEVAALMFSKLRVR